MKQTIFVLPCKKKEAQSDNTFNVEKVKRDIDVE
jgi:hypothetical protein